jgi:hypothetical protein
MGSQCDYCRDTHEQWECDGKKGDGPQCMPGVRFQCCACSSCNGKCSLVPVNHQVVKWLVKGTEESRLSCRWKCIESTVVRGTPLWSNVVGEEPMLWSVCVDIIMAQVQAVTAVTKDPVSELVQCAITARWEAAETMNAVEATEVEVRRLEEELCIASAQASEACSMRQQLVNVTEYVAAMQDLVHTQIEDKEDKDD